MELQARVTALEEELSIVKGEIKAILQEVRVAVLARQNPFLEDEFDASFASRPAVSGWPVDEPFATEPPPAPQRPGAAAAAALQAGPALQVVAQTAPQPASEPQPDTPSGVRDAGQLSGALDLAGLLAWLQETAEQFNPAEFRMLIQLAAYGGLIDGGLEQSLVELGESVPDTGTRKASLPEFALALQKLEAVRAMKTISRPTSRRPAA